MRHPAEEETPVATATLAATLNTPISELRSATMDRVLVIEDDDVLRKILPRPFSSPRESPARLCADQTCSARQSENLCFFEDVMVDFSKMEITHGGEKITVPAKELKAL